MRTVALQKSLTIGQSSKLTQQKNDIYFCRRIVD